MASTRPIIIVPMAGLGSRFASQGYDRIKPLIEIEPGLPMIKAVVDSIGIEGDLLFIVQKLHRENTDVEQVLCGYWPDAEIIDTGGGITEGAACTVLLAKPILDMERPLLIVNSDNILQWNGQHKYNVWLHLSKSDGMIGTFVSDDPKYSYVRTDERGRILEVVEKRVVSAFATSGVYGWRTAKQFIYAAEEMIERNERVGNEFYVAPVYNQNLLYDPAFDIYLAACGMTSVGTPDDLIAYQNRTR